MMAFDTRKESKFQDLGGKEDQNSAKHLSQKNVEIRKKTCEKKIWLEFSFEVGFVSLIPFAAKYKKETLSYF